MNKLRQEILEILSMTEADRPAALRRSRLEEFLYTTDLPQVASEDTIDVFCREAEKNGWRTKITGSWIQLDRLPDTVIPDFLPDRTCREAECCASLLQRNSGRRRNGDREKRMLLKAAEEGPEAFGKVCGILHGEFAAALRKKEALPDIPAEYFRGGKQLC